MTPGTLPFVEGTERAGLWPRVQDLRQATRGQDLLKTFTVYKSFLPGLEPCTVTLSHRQAQP